VESWTEGPPVAVSCSKSLAEATSAVGRLIVGLPLLPDQIAVQLLSVSCIRDTPHFCVSERNTVCS
jgi:hypothetical protein